MKYNFHFFDKNLSIFIYYDAFNGRVDEKTNYFIGIYKENHFIYGFLYLKYT